MRDSFVIILCLLFVGVTKAQNTWDLKQYNVEACKKCVTEMNNLPSDVGLKVVRENTQLFLVCNNKNWFDDLFKESADAISIEIMQRQQFVCYGENQYWSKPISQGVLMEPINAKDFKKRMVDDKQYVVKIKLGAVPKEVLDKELEFNILLINSKTACYRKLLYNIDAYTWSMLDMGIFLDTVTYLQNGNLSTQYNYIRNKSMSFVVPFERGKSDYQPQDLKNLYDSLNITDFEISRLSIRAYASVEGSEDKNLELQEKRAKSISKALQSYQKSNITTEISTSENWVEFMDDIAKTPNAALASYNKHDIKIRLKNADLREELEPILQKHRKAVITIDLIQKNDIQSMSGDQLKAAFKKALAEQNIKAAIMLQKQYFSKLATKTATGKLDIPNQKEFVPLLSNAIIYSYWFEKKDPQQTIGELEKLEVLLPKYGAVKYNKCVIKLRMWQQTQDISDPVRLLKEINDLKLVGIDARLIKRMIVNYNLLMSESYVAKSDYSNRDKCLAVISMNYKQIPFNAQDIVNLAVYFVNNAKYDAAIKMLSPFIKQLDCDENLLFYYINLTITKEEFVKKTEYRSVLLNANNINPKRYCKLFNSYGTGGITFQLLSNDFLKNAYCESCSN